jgi:hypothetical protein
MYFPTEVVSVPIGIRQKSATAKRGMMAGRVKRERGGGTADWYSKKISPMLTLKIKCTDALISTFLCDSPPQRIDKIRANTLFQTNQKQDQMPWSITMYIDSRVHVTKKSDQLYATPLRAEDGDFDLDTRFERD